MKITYAVTRRHAILRGVDDDMVEPPSTIPPAAFKWLREWYATDAPIGVLARHEKKIVGFFRYRLARSHSGFQALEPLGTWVAHGYRRRRIAENMWFKAILGAQPPVNGCRVYVATRAGGAFARHMAKEFSFIFFDIWGPGR